MTVCDCMGLKDKYDSKEDALRVSVPSQQTSTMEERLVYEVMPSGFEIRWEYSCWGSLHWRWAGYCGCTGARVKANNGGVKVLDNHDGTEAMCYVFTHSDK